MSKYKRDPEKNRQAFMKWYNSLSGEAKKEHNRIRYLKYASKWAKQRNEKRQQSKNIVV